MQSGWNSKNDHPLPPPSSLFLNLDSRGAFGARGLVPGGNVKMARTDPQVRIALDNGKTPTGFRMPDRLKDRLREAAAGNRRSMNSEIVARLEASFSADGQGLEGEIASLIKSHVDAEVQRRLREIALQIGGSP